MLSVLSQRLPPPPRPPCSLRLVFSLGGTQLDISRIGRRAVCVLALVALPLLTGCGFAVGKSTQPSAGQLVHVQLALDWLPNTNHTGIYVALQKGFYRENGIQLELTPYSSAATPEQLVSAGQANFGISFTESVT